MPMRILQINACYPNGSTGATTRDLHRWLLAEGHESFVASPVFHVPLEPRFYRIGTPLGKKLHALEERVTGYQAHGSRCATRALCRYIDKIAPDVVHLRNVHSHFLSLPILLNHIADRDMALCVNLHDCWFFTGRCVHYTRNGCTQWRTGCGKCPKGYYGIKTWLFDRSAEMARERRALFARIRRLGVIGVADWVVDAAKSSFIFKDHPTVRWGRIYNWVDGGTFQPKDPAPLRAQLQIPDGGKMILGVAPYWSDRKGLGTFLEIAPLLNPNERIVLVGLEPKQPLPGNIIAVGKITDRNTLAAYYSAADLFFQVSKEETFGKVPLESLSCGTPVMAYESTGNAELIQTGSAYSLKPDAAPSEIVDLIRKITAEPKPVERIRAEAQERYNPGKSLGEYLGFYRELLEGAG